MKTRIRLDIETREAFAEGAGFGEVGPYEKLEGWVHFAVDPEAAENAMVVDIQKAPQNGDGLVEYSTEFCILKPAVLSKGSRRLVFDVCNRGNKRLLQYFNDAPQVDRPTTLEDAGNGFLMRRGHTVVWCGWQGDVMPVEGRMTMKVPTATENGKEITGPVRMEYVPSEEGTVSVPLSGNDHTTSYETVSLDTSGARLTYRHYPYDKRIEIPPEEWRFAKVGDRGEPEPSSRHCYLPSGFRPGWIYELVYTGKNPTVLGLGFLAVRDLVSFLRHAAVDDEGMANPLRDEGIQMEKAYAWGISQSGRYLREFIYRGYNLDSEGSKVFDGVWPHVAGAGRVWLNGRFAQPGRYPCQQTNHTYPSDQFPFAYSTTTDHHTGKTDGIMKRRSSDPLLFHTQTSAEYWERRGSLAHTDTQGSDVKAPENVRLYHYTGAQHSNQPGDPPEIGPHRYPTNPLNVTPIHRALLDALDAWATHGTAPPESRIPSRADESLVPTEVAGGRFPGIPGVTSPKEGSRLYVQDHGPEFENGIVSKEPTEEDLTREYVALVPQVDGDGNDAPGVRTPDVSAPLATYTGWNYRPKEWAENSLDDLKGSYFPFAKSEAERRRSGDPRPSLEERYGTRGRYVRNVAAAAERMVAERLLLEEDADRYVERAMREEGLG